LSTRRRVTWCSPTGVFSERLDELDKIDAADHKARGRACPLDRPCGNAHYAAPELILNKPYGLAVDAWALGIVLNASLTGRFPFFGTASSEIAHAIVVASPNPMPAHISANARAVILGLLHPDPHKRLTPQQALEHRWLQSL
jgi:serine/threonine protein kinase